MGPANGLRYRTRYMPWCRPPPIHHCTNYCSGDCCARASDCCAVDLTWDPPALFLAVLAFLRTVLEEQNCTAAQAN